MSGPAEKVAAEVAEVEFRSWLVDMGLAYKVDDPKMNQEDRDSLEKAKLPVIDAIRFGRLVRNDAGEFVFAPQLGDGGPITFFEPTGADILAMDKAGKKDENVTKSYAILAAMTKQNSARFGAMKNRDLVVCQSIMTFFLGR